MDTDRKVSLFTKAIQIDETGDKNEIEFFVEAAYIEKANGRYLTYKETELSGMEGTTTTLKVTEDSLSIIRFGTYNSKLEFRKGEQTLTNYQTPYGNIPIRIHTKRLDIELKSGEKSSIRLEYTMESGGESALKNEIMISYK